MGKNVIRNIGIVIAGLAALVWIIALSTPNSTPLSADEQRKAIIEYYGQLTTLNNTLNLNYAMTTKKVARGDVQGAYLDFKQTGEPLFRNATATFLSLESKVPNVDDKKLLSEAAKNLRLYAGVRDDAIKLFLESVEETKPGKMLEAQTKNERADKYLSDAMALLDEISRKYGMNK